jgi:3',5'-cyclic AMP phosphodiesterase CpdA
METMRVTLALLLALSLLLSCSALAQNNKDIVNMTEENEVVFAVISDPHMGSSEPSNTNKMFHYNQDILKWMVEEINSNSDIDFVLVLGDITKDSEPLNHVRAKDMLGKLNVPYYVLPGNHDVNKTYIENEMGIEDFVKTFQGHGYTNNSSYYSLDPAPGVHLVSLDTASDSRLADTWAGGLSEEQIAWLDEDLNKTGDKTVIIMAHHALINHTGKNDSNWYIDNRDDVLEIMKNYGVQIIFTGHLHTTDIAEKDGIYDISCPGTCTYPLAYRMAKLEDDTLTVNTFWYPDEKVRGIAEAEFILNGWEGTIEQMKGEFSDRYAVLELENSTPEISFRVPA